MADKYYSEAVDVLVKAGMAKAEAATMSRLANGFRKNLGLDDIGLWNSKGELATRTKVTGKSVSVKVSDGAKLKLAEGKGAPIGAHALRFVECVAELSAYGECVSVTLPEFAASSHAKFLKEAAAAAAPAETPAETPTETSNG